MHVQNFKSFPKPFVVPLKLTGNSYTKSTKMSRKVNLEIFYSLGDSEEKSMDFGNGAMKPIAEDVKSEKQTRGYLEARYRQRPSNRFNFPEATSFRYGWI
jgi:hypothetical protein